ncbi:hypothetical protein EUGRSUZ_K03252 [Eucalyptus grandis]|uniref:Uncharacterized protein n=2 Tax=Eucalyptus grandis TaxID=71139 RepID=A0ACC3IYV0_EUCGR|nr:hypothetical protein EUGRSUZ_K03252 [Eucalyptus grandis]
MLEPVHGQRLALPELHCVREVGDLPGFPHNRVELEGHPEPLGEVGRDGVEDLESGVDAPVVDEGQANAEPRVDDPARHRLGEVGDDPLGARRAVGRGHLGQLEQHSMRLAQVVHRNSHGTLKEERQQAKAVALARACFIAPMNRVAVALEVVMDGIPPQSLPRPQVVEDRRDAILRRHL